MQKKTSRHTLHMGNENSFKNAYLGVFSFQYLADSLNNELGLHFKLINTNTFNTL